MADDAAIAQLDVIFIVLTCLTLVHATSRQGLRQGTTTVIFLLLHTAAFEHISLFLGGTHCHASSPYLPMVTPCSSINSILFYVPWIYTSLEAARRLDFPPSSFPFLVGLLQFGFGVPYEMQGPAQAFWQWPTHDGIIAEESDLLASWQGYPPLDFLEEAQRAGEVATISSTGVFRVSEHAREALSSRVCLFPVLAPYFHFAYGFAWALGLVLTGAVTSTAIPTFRRLLFSGLLVPILFLPPIEVTRQISSWTNLPIHIGVPISLMTSFLFVFLTLIQRTKPPKDINTTTTSSSKISTDGLLFTISLLMHAFMATIPWRFHIMTRPSPFGLPVLVVITSMIHLAMQYYCCLHVGVEDFMKKRWIWNEKPKNI